MRFGTMVHRAVLEPDKYQATVAVYDGRRGTNAHKEFMLENAHKDVLTVKEAATVRSISDSVLNHSYAGPLLRQCTEFEKAFQIEQLGIPHRGIIDAIGPWFMIDLKTTQNVSHRMLQRTIYDFKYYMQAAIYDRAATIIGLDMKAYFIIAVESTAPHHVEVVELEPHYIARGHLEWERLLGRWSQWNGTAAHSHLGDDGFVIDAPGYAPAMDIGI